MSNYKILFVLIGVILAFGSVYYVNFNVGNTKKIINSSDEAVSSNISATVSTDVESTNGDEIHSLSESSESYEKLLHEIEEVTKNNVIGVDRNNSDYANYPDSLLRDLADKGDLLAIKMLALRYSEHAKSLRDTDAYVAERKKVEEMYDKAIVHGDKEFLGFMPGLRAAESRISDPRLTAEQKHQAAIEMLAHMEFMGLRGALKQKYTDQRMAFETYKDFGFPQVLTEEDKMMVRKRAKEIYDAYERKRAELGLGPFDNSIPEEIAKGYERDRQEYEEKMGSNAI